MKLTVRKVDPTDPSRCRFDDARSLYAWSTYDIEVIADEFASDLTSACTLDLLHVIGEDNTVCATCTLTADPFRRKTRTGTLVIGDEAHAVYFDTLIASHSSDLGKLQYIDQNFTLSVTLGTSNSVVLLATVPVTMGKRAVSASSSQRVESTSGLWTQIEESTVVKDKETTPQFYTKDSLGNDAIALPVADRTQTHYTIDLKALSGNFNVVLVPTSGGSVVTTGLFEAYVMITTQDVGETCENKGSWASAGTESKVGPRLGDILVGQTLPPSSVSDATVHPVFDYDDSATLVSETNTFITHLNRLPFASGWHAAFRVDKVVAAGIEVDPEGNAIPGVGIN